MSPRAGICCAMLLALVQPVVAQQSSGTCAPQNLASLSGWDGVWIAEGMQLPISGRPDPGSIGDLKVAQMAGMSAPWNETGLLRWEDMVRGGLNGPGYKIAGWAFPVMMNSFAPLTFVITLRETVIISQYREIRHVHTDGRPHLPEEERWPTPWGDSIGCWKGDTLTIQTVGVGDSARFNPGTPPLSPEARFVETLRLVAPGRLDSTMTIVDPATLREPWIIHIVYIRARNTERLIHDGDMFDNDRTDNSGAAPTIAAARPEQKPATPAPEVRLAAAELDRFTGDYASEAPRLLLRVERRGDRLWIGQGNPPQLFAPLHASGPLSFYMRILDITLRFQADAAGNVTGLEQLGADGPVQAKRLALPVPTATADGH